MIRKATGALTALVVAGSISTAPLAANDCYDYVIGLCDAAMAESNFIEKIAVGVFCAGMMAGCAGHSVIN